jgi:hypothetical protein
VPLPLCLRLRLLARRPLPAPSGVHRLPRSIRASACHTRLCPSACASVCSPVARPPRRQPVDMSSSSTTGGTRWEHAPLLDCPDCHVPLIRIQSKQLNSLKEWFVKCPNNIKVRICTAY